MGGALFSPHKQPVPYVLLVNIEESKDDQYYPPMFVDKRHTAESDLLV